MFSMKLRKFALFENSKFVMTLGNIYVIERFTPDKILLTNLYIYLYLYIDENYFEILLLPL